MVSTTRIGKRGTVVIPASLRRDYGLDEGALVIAEPTEDGILLRPAVAMPIERYSAKRRAEFLLTNAVDESDYMQARAAVEALGLDPDSIPHVKPVA